MTKNTDQHSDDNTDHAEEEEVYLDDETEEEGGGILRSITTISIVLLAAGGFIALAWYAYNFNTTERSVNDVPVVKADTQPTKEKPEEPGGMVVPNMDKTVYDNFSGNNEGEALPKVERILPAPEEPVGQEKIAGGKEMASTPPSATSSVSSSQPSNEAAHSVPKEAPVRVAEAKVKEQAIVEAKPPVVSSTEKTALKPVSPSDLRPAPKGKNLKEATPKKQMAMSGFKVQLGSFKTEKEALASWNQVQKQYAELLGKLTPSVERKDLGSKGIFYRLQAGVITRGSDARLLCTKLIEQKQGCFVVKQ